MPYFAHIGFRRPLIRALCLSHARRYFYELAELDTQFKMRRKKAAVISHIGVEAVRRIDAIFDFERSINGRSVAERRPVRQDHSAPLVADLEAWLCETRSKLSKSSLAVVPINYMLRTWPAYNDGCICLPNNAVEQVLREIALARRSWLFASPDRGGWRTTIRLSLIATAKLNDLGTQAWIANVLGRPANIPQRQLADLLP